MSINYELYADYNYTYKRTIAIELYRKQRVSAVDTPWVLWETKYMSFTPDDLNPKKTYHGSITFTDISSYSDYYILFRNESAVVNNDYTPKFYAAGCKFSIYQ